MTARPIQRISPSPNEIPPINTESLSRRRAKRIRSLAHKKYRQEHGQFIVEGRRAVEAALEARAPITELVVAETALSDERIETLATNSGIPVYQCADDLFSRLSHVEHAQGILAVVEFRIRGIDDLRDCTTIVALDGVQDPGNAGTLLRTAAWFGVDAALAGAGTVDLANPKVVRAAMGAHWEVTLAATDRLDTAIERLRSSGIIPYAADLNGTPVTSWRPETPSLLVLGSEAHGISAAVQHQVHERVYIARPEGRLTRPTGVESLNVAVASGIVLHHWLQ